MTKITINKYVHQSIDSLKADKLLRLGIETASNEHGDIFIDTDWVLEMKDERDDIPKWIIEMAEFADKQEAFMLHLTC